MSTENISLMRASSDYDGWDPSSIFSNGNSGNISDDSMNDKDDDEVVDKGRKSDSSAGHVRKHSLHHIDRSDNAAESRRTSKRGDQIDADRNSSASAYVMSSGDDHDHPENQEEVIEVTEEDEEIKEEEETEEKDEHETTISKLLPDEETQRDELDEQQILNDEAFNNQDFITSEKNLLDKSGEGNQSEITQHPNLESVNLAQLHERSIDDIGRDAQQERKKIMSHGKLLKMNERRGSQKRDLVATLDKQTIDCEEGRVQMSNINGEKREGVDGEMQGARKLSHKMMEGNKELLKSQVEIETSNVKNEEYSKPSQLKIAQNNGREKAREQRKDQEDKQQKVIIAAAATTTTAVVVVAVAAVAARQLSVDKEAKLMMQREIEKVQEAQEKYKRDEESLRKGEEEKREREREAREEEEEEERLRIEEEAKREREREREECEEKEAKIEREAREEEEESLRIEEEAKRERVREREAREEEEKEESLRIEEEAKREREREEREEKECTLLQVTGETFREEDRRNVEQIEEITVGEEEVRGLIIEEEDSDCNETELREQPIVDLEFERNRQEVLLAAAATTTTAVVLVAVASISAKQLAAGMLGMGEEILSREEVEEIMELAGEPLKSKMMMTDIEEKMSYEDRDTEILGEGDNHYGERKEIEEQSEGEGEGEITEEVEEADLEERDVLEDSLQESVIEAGSEHDKGRMEIETADGLHSGHVASFSDSLNIGVDSLNCTAISSRKVAEMGRKVEVGEDLDVDVDEEGEQEEVEEEGDDENIDELEISELDSPGMKKITQIKNIRPQSSSINEKESAARTVQRVYRGVQGR